MMLRLNRWVVLWLMVGLWLGAWPTEAVMIQGPAGRNTSAPVGALADSGWAYQGNWAGFLGTPISPRHFITASHIGGSIGGRFVYQETSYVTTATWKDPETDLRIWEVSGTFDTFAPLYTQDDEQGRGLTVFGRGTDRGSELVVNNEIKGWRWGASDGDRSWGQNTVSQVHDRSHLLEFTFDADGGPNESHLSIGDSGGGVFIQDDQGQWRLAAINFAVTGPYRLSANGPNINAALLDEGGFFIQLSGNMWRLQADTIFDRPGASFVTRISSRAEWIDSVIPEPSIASMLLVGFLIAVSHRSRRIAVWHGVR